MRLVAILGAAVVAVTLSLVSAAGVDARALKEGGTFRVAAAGGFFGGIDPGQTGPLLDLLRPACGTLMAYPDERLPPGLRLAPELAASGPRISKDRRTYTFTIRRNARFSTGTPVTARDFAHALERILTPTMQSGLAPFFQDVVGASSMLAGKATSLRGAVAHGRTLTLKLVKPVPDLPARMTLLCAAPANLPVDPEGARAPLPSAAPYYVAEYVADQRLVLERNTFYRGRRPHHVDRIVEDLASDAAAGLDQVTKGEIEYVWPTTDLNPRLAELARRYGVGRSQFFVQSSLGGRMFFLNTSRPLFRGNAKLRQAVNFAVDRKALVRELGPYAATATDQFLPPAIPGFRDERIYPLDGPNLRKARSLASGRTRSRKVILYTCTDPGYCVAPAQVLQRNLKTIGLKVEIKQFPIGVLFQKAATRREPFDAVLLGWFGAYNDPREFMLLFDGRAGTSNYSRFNSPTYNRLLDRAAGLSGDARYRAFGRLDVQLARDAAPAIPYAVYNAFAFVSNRVGCVVMNPFLDLTAVCLK